MLRPAQALSKGIALGVAGYQKPETQQPVWNLLPKSQISSLCSVQYRKPWRHQYVQELISFYCLKDCLNTKTPQNTRPKKTPPGRLVIFFLLSALILEASSNTPSQGHTLLSWWRRQFALFRFGPKTVLLASNQRAFPWAVLLPRNLFFSPEDPFTSMGRACENAGCQASLVPESSLQELRTRVVISSSNGRSGLDDPTGAVAESL